MRKFYSLVLSALVAIPMAMNAQMTEENETLANYEDGYRLEKDVDFKAATVNGVAIEPAYSLQFGAEVSGVKINGYVPKFLTNTGLEFMSFSLPGDNIDWPNNNALRSTKNERWIGIHYLREGQIVVFDVSNKDAAQFVPNSIACNKNTGWADTPQEPQILEEISQEIHDLQDLSAERDPETGEIISSNTDAFRYFRVINSGDCYIKFNGKTANYLSHFQIWSPAGEAEVVSIPSLKVVGVDGEARQLEFKPGESTFGSKVVTYYSTDGDDPVFLKEVFDHYDYVYETDGEGNVIYNDGLPVVKEEIPVYKKVLDESQFVDVDNTIYYGPNAPFNPDDGYIYVDASDDEDGDGKVTVKAVSVSESTLVISEIQEIEVNVGEIQLNAPTLTLVGINGTERTYKMTWNNNTLCGEPYGFIFENGEELYVEYDWDSETNSNPAFDATFSSETTIKMTVRVEGYIDGVTEIEVYEAGKDYSPVAEEGKHDWDFQNLTQEQLDMINQKLIDHYYIEDEDGNVKATYTIEEYEAGVGDDGTDLLGDNVVLPAYFVCGWDGSDSRNANRHWRTWIPTYELDDNLQPTTTIVSTAYAEDKTGLLDGLTVDNDHPSWSTMAIFTNKEGLYFMSKGTLKVNEVKYGQIVVLTTNTGVTVAKVDNAPEGYEFTIGKGTYVYSIDIVTPDVLPDVPYELVGVEGVKAADAKKGVRYNLAGQRVNKAYKGLVIEDGKVLLVP